MLVLAVFFLVASRAEAKSYVVKLKSLPSSTLSTWASQMGAASIVHGDRVQVVEIENSLDLEALKADPRVELVEEDILFHGDELPNDPELLVSQWNLINEGSDSLGGGDIDATDAWTLVGSGGSRNVIIWSIDSGMDVNSPDLHANLVETEDGVLGYDFVNNDPDPDPENAHGTHTSSIHSAAANDGSTIAGVAYSSRVVPVKFLNASNEGKLSNAYRALRYTIDLIREMNERDPNLRHVINNSWGGPSSSGLIYEAFKELSELGALSVASAGNEGSNINDEESSGYWPCMIDLPELVCVAAHDQNGDLSPFSNWGPLSVDIMAPGSNINGIIGSRRIDGDHFESVVGLKSGTSQAAPHVAGVAALIWTVQPAFTASQVKSIILHSTDWVPGAEDWVLSGGRLNAYAAVSLAQELDPENFDLAEQNRPKESSGGGCSVAHGLGHAPQIGVDADFAAMLGFIIPLLVPLLGLLALRRRRPQGARNS